MGKETFFSVTMSHQMIKDLLFQFLFAIQMFWVKMHFVLLLIHSSKVRYKIPNLYRPKKILMDSGKFLGYGLYVTYYLSQPVLNTSSLSRTVRDGMELMFYN